MKIEPVLENEDDKDKSIPIRNNSEMVIYNKHNTLNVKLILAFTIILLSMEGRVLERHGLLKKER